VGRGGVEPPTFHFRCTARPSLDSECVIAGEATRVLRAAAGLDGPPFTAALRTLRCRNGGDWWERSGANVRTCAHSAHGSRASSSSLPCGPPCACLQKMAPRAARALYSSPCRGARVRTPGEWSWPLGQPCLLLSPSAPCFGTLSVTGPDSDRSDVRSSARPRGTRQTCLGWFVPGSL
jgi:hypothetical protein